MAPGYLDQKGDLYAAGVGIYVVLLVGTLVPLFRHGLRLHAGYFFILAFCAIKIVGDAMSIYVQLTLKTSLAEAAAIISTVVLSPLLLATGAMVYPSGYKPTNRNGVIQNGQIIAKLSSLLIVASLAVGIVGGLQVFGSDVGRYDEGKKLIQTAAGCACGAWFLICIFVAGYWDERKSLTRFHRLLYPVVATWVLPLFVLRLVYSVGVAATIDTGRSQVFNPLTGSWILYLFLAWLPEVLIGGALIVVGILWQSEEDLG